MPARCPAGRNGRGRWGFLLNGVDVRAATVSSRLRAFFTGLMEEFDPDVIITSTDDPAQLLFEVARRSVRARLVYLVRATIAVPFGPDSSLQSRTRTAALASADGIVGVSEYVAKYVRDHSGLPAIHVPISLMESAETSVLGRFDNPFVSMVNPVRSERHRDIFLALADRLPQLSFAAVPTWGTTPDDLAALGRRPNVAILQPVDRIDELLAQTRVVLVPSVWAEARSRLVMEGMLRGVPVMASDTGGLREAKPGVLHVLPVKSGAPLRAGARQQHGACRGGASAGCRTLAGCAGTVDQRPRALGKHFSAFSRGRARIFPPTGPHSTIREFPFRAAGSTQALGTGQGSAARPAWTRNGASSWLCD